MYFRPEGCRDESLGLGPKDAGCLLELDLSVLISISIEVDWE